MRDWEQATRFGATEATVREHDRRLSHIDRRMDAQQREIDTLRTHIIRGGLLVVLALATLGAGLGAKEAGELAGTTLKSLIR